MGTELRFPMHATRRGETPDIPTLFAPQPLKRRDLAAGDGPHLVGVKAADSLFIAVGKASNPAPGCIAGEACNEITPDDRGAVQPDE